MMTPGSTSQRSRWNLLLHEGLSSIVVFLIALPLCMGIAVACGVPPALGIISGIIGGLVVGTLAGAPLQVSGPAAGLTVLVFELIHKHGLSALGVVVLLAGAIQVVAGLLKLGRWFRSVSPAVIHGMLAGIGVLIFAAQFHVMFDVKPGSSGLPNILAIPRTIYHALALSDGSNQLFAGITAGITIGVLLLWKSIGLDKKTKIPAPLPAIVVAGLVAVLFHFPIAFVNVPDNIVSVLTFPTSEALSSLLEGSVLLSALTLALIASAETLLSATAVDKMQNGPRAKYDKELIAQGVGNMLCGFIGSLPITGVIVRSSVNVQAGAKTRLSAILHGAWLLLAILLFPFLLKMVPISALAALLVYTGCKLVDLKVLKELRQFGQTEIVIYLTTLGFIISTDLLTGVLVGLLLSLAKLVLKLCRLESDLQPTDAGKYQLTLRGTATFLTVSTLSEALEAVPAGSEVTVNCQLLAYIDHACIEALKDWEVRHKQNGGTLIVDWEDLVRRYKTPASTTKELDFTPKL